MPVKTTARRVPTKKVAEPKKATEDTITGVTIANAEREPANRPESFEALRLRDLQAAADAFGVDWAGLTEEEIRANLAADYITFKMYAEQFNLPDWENLPDDEEPVLLEPHTEGGEEVSDIITAPAVAKLEEGKYLIKFVGKNWYFERGNFRFTKDSPYALMNAREAQAALVEEPTKFRQAMPAELEEYYN